MEFAMINGIAALRATALVLMAAVCGNPVLSAVWERKDYPIRPVPFTQAHVNDAFWLPRLETNRTATIPFLFEKNEETGRIDKFAIAAAQEPDGYLFTARTCDPAHPRPGGRPIVLVPY